MTKDELYRQYKEALAQLEQQANEARERVEVTFKEQLRAIRKKAHEDTTAICVIEQQAHEARERVRVTFKEQLKAIRNEAHKELKAIRTLEQETRRNR